MKSFVPRLDRLEGRETPASLVLNGNTLTYLGDGQSHTVTFTDDGAGNVTGKLDNNAPVVGSGVGNIQVFSLAGGSDKITDTLTKARVASETMTVAVGSGTTVTANFQPGTQSGNFRFLDNRSGNTGKNTIKLGAVAAGASEFVMVNNLFSSGALCLSRTGNIAGSATDLDFSMQSTNSTTVSYTGTVTGTYRADTFGMMSSGSYTMKVNIGSGSTGQVSVGEVGSTTGGDKLTLSVTDNSNGSAAVSAFALSTQQNIDNGNVITTKNVNVLKY
jgi:hypothetical protein